VRYAVLVLQHFSGGKSDQIKYLVQQGCIPPLCELLTVHDAKIVTVALEGLENILKVYNHAILRRVLRNACVIALATVQQCLLDVDQCRSES
jgi:Armadillo/beta-catenin-like repeat